MGAKKKPRQPGLQRQWCKCPCSLVHLAACLLQALWKVKQVPVASSSYWLANSGSTGHTSLFCFLGSSPNRCHRHTQPLPPDPFSPRSFLPQGKSSSVHKFPMTQNESQHRAPLRRKTQVTVMWVLARKASGNTAVSGANLQLPYLEAEATSS